MLDLILNTSIFDFSAIDNNAITVAIVGYSVVFGALVILFYLFSLIPKLINLKIKQRLIKEGKTDCIDKIGEEISGDVNAAIAMATSLT